MVVSARVIEAAATDAVQHLGYAGMKPEKLCLVSFSEMYLVFCLMALGRACALHAFLQCLTE